jgi:hypothetical protein
MKSLLTLVTLVTSLVGCGSSSTPPNNNTTPDAPGSSGPPADAFVFEDAPVVVPNSITIKGTATEDGQSTSTPLAGVAIGIYADGNDTTPVATATSAADGTYTLTVSTNGQEVTGYLKATLSGYTDNYAYPVGPYQANATGADANMISTSNFGLLGLLGGQTATNGVIVAQIIDTTGAAVVGAKVTSAPASGKYLYSDANGTPTSTTGTNTDGAAFFFNVPAGALTVSATKSGSSFHSHALTARAGVFTTTQISE